MYLLFFFILLLAVFVYALFEKLSTLAFQVDTDRNDIHVLFYWLYPLITASVQMLNYSPHLDIYLLKMRVYSKNIQKRTDNAPKQWDFIKTIDFKDAYAQIRYGLENPFETSMASSMIGILQQYVNQISIQLYPDFVPDHEYVVIQAGAKLNIGKTLVNVLKLRNSLRKIKRSENYGSVQYG